MFIPVGPIADSGALIMGGIAGAFLGRWLPERVKTSLPLIFGVITVCIGSTLVGKALYFPVVVMALITGTFLGELIYLEKGMEAVIRKCLQWSDKAEHKADPVFMIQFITLISVFCFGSMGMFGAIEEGMTGKPDLLITKAVLDLFSGIIFGSTVGYRVALIGIPQFIVLISLFYSSGLFMPYVSPAMLGDFSSCGGVIFMATGLRMCGIKIFPIVNMIPALLLVMPMSALWTRFFG